MQTIMIIVILLLLLMPSDAQSNSDVVRKSHFQKPTQPMELKVSTILQDSSPSSVHCAGLCRECDECRFYLWTAETTSCTLYQDAVPGMPTVFSADLLINQGPLPCPENKIPNEKGDCVCPVNQYGPLCNGTFTLEAKMQQMLRMDWAIDANYLEIDGISFLFFLSYGNGSFDLPTASGYISIYSCDKRVSSTYEQRQLIYTDTFTQRLNVFQSDGNSYVTLTSQRSTVSPLAVPHMLYKYDSISQSFIEQFRWNEPGGGLSAVYQRPNGDVYLCLGAINVNGYPDQNPYIYKFDPHYEMFQRTFNIPQIGLHSTCTLFEIDGEFYSLTAIMNGNRFNQIYQLNQDETWSWYQDVPLTNTLSIKGFNVYTSPQLSLLVASIENGNVIVYRWNGTQFILLQILSIDGQPEYPYFVELAGDLCLLIGNSSANAVTFATYKYNNMMDLFDSLSTATSVGSTNRFLAFRYDDNLHLIIVNRNNGFLDMSDPNKNRADQQLIRFI